MDLSKIKPLHDLVLIQRDKAKAQEGPIHLPDDRIEQSYWVTVLAVGPGRLLPNGKRTPMNFKPGDRCFCRQYEGLRLIPELGWNSPQIVQDIALEAILDE